MQKKERIVLPNGGKRKKLFKSKIRKEQKILLIFFGILVCFTALFIAGAATSIKIQTRSFTIEYSNLPAQFDGYKIVQLSDYHKRVYANESEDLIEAVKAAGPDIIVMTGDIIDENSKDVDGIVGLCAGMLDIAPVLWVRGNHFYKADEALAAQLERKLTDMGVVQLVNECYVVSRDGENIKFCGVDDPQNYYSGENFPTEYLRAAKSKVMERFLDETDENSNGKNGFKVLLTHRYTVYEKFPEHGYSIALAGHSHGGQFKLPGGIDVIGALYGVDLFPKIKSGYNDVNGMPLIISSGLGASNINLRLYNPPEIVAVELKNK